jgi:hypothetical protein
MAKARASIASLETDVRDSPENESVSDRTQLSKNRIDLDISRCGSIAKAAKPHPFEEGAKATTGEITSRRCTLCSTSSTSRVVI